MKKICSVFLLLASAVILLSIYNNKTNSQVLSKCCLPSDEIGNILSAREPTKAKLINELFFDDIPLFEDKETNSWFLTTSSTINQNPIVRFSSVDPAVRIVFPEKIDFLSGETLSFIAYNSSTYNLFKLVITSLPLINIEYSATEISRESIPMRLTLYDSDSKKYIASEGTIHVRGNSTSEFPKTSFRISLLRNENNGKEKDANLLGLREDDDWILYSAYFDPEKIRNVFSANLWYFSCAQRNNFGINNGMEYRYIELFLNSEYWGLYAISYPIDAKQQHIRITPFGNYDEYLYKQRFRGPVFYGEKMEDYLDLQYPGNDDDNAIGMFLREKYFKQLIDSDTVDFYINDTQNAIDIWLFMKLIQGIDHVEHIGKPLPYDIGITKNKTANFMYTIKKTSDGHQVLITPWDLDKTWGLFYHFDNPLQYADPTDNGFEMTLNPVSVLLKNGDAEIVKQIQNEYLNLRENEWSNETIDQMLNAMESDIFDSGAFEREQNRWLEGNYSDSQRKLSNFRQYVHQRFASMDEYIASL